MPVKAPIVDGKLVLDTPKQGRITGDIEIPGPIKVRLAQGNVANGVNEFAAVTYVDGTKDTPYENLNFLSVHYGPGEMVFSLFPEGRGKWRIYKGYVVTLG